ncbi:hsp70 nucleotide exchange factor FES1 [Cucumis melo var. makuwa]|uniref:Hsp70 nucleotide exchange factor FES1 n=1 Tax=Cucumis melo var. makuwa TaxID=1194695 RepID=A0A5A7TF37_CUCMM|nr:hsp70 nucleotide exchange factor FES1 [Cucumis melo var. makuwa]
MRRSLVVGLCLWFSLTLVIADANDSSLEGLIWSSAKEDSAAAAAPVVHDADGFDGGFSSLDSMLQWAIGHSDPAKLKDTAQDVKQLSPSEIKKRQEEIKDLIEELKLPSDAKLMQIAVDDLKNSSLSLEDRHRALQELLVLVEPIDNANDLDKLGGLAVLTRELNHVDPDVRKIAAWILGKASQNNPIVQKQVRPYIANILIDLIVELFLQLQSCFQVLELGALAKLVSMVKSDFVEEAIKALYAISSLVQNNLSGQKLFYAEAGETMLQDILSNSSMDIRLQKKTVFLASDLAVTQLEKPDEAERPFFGDRFFLKSVVNLIHSTDIDLQEKALIALKNLLLLRTTKGQVLKEFCGLDAALERMRMKLKVLMEEEDHRDYAMDVEDLRSQVEQIFLEKLGKVPT